MPLAQRVVVARASIVAIGMREHHVIDAQQTNSRGAVDR
jgi:hypothetical protein